MADNCTMSPATIEFSAKFELGIYFVLTWLYLTVGLSTNIVLLFAFYKQSKTEKAYGYQVIFTVSKTLEIFAFGTYLLEGKGLGTRANGPKWFLSNWFLMEYFMLGLGLHISFIVCSLLLSISMAADRVFALLKPMVYKNINHFRHQIFATITCLLIGFLGGGMYFFDMKMLKYVSPRFNETVFGGYFDNDLDKTVLGQVSFYFRLILRVGGLVLLIFLNAIMVNCFRKRMRKVAALTKSKDEKRKAAEKQLLWLNIYQACLMLVNQLPHVSWQILLFVLPLGFERCEGRFIGPFCDGMIMLTDTVDFFIVLTVNKQMKKIVKNALPKWLFRESVNNESTTRSEIPMSRTGTDRVSVTLVKASSSNNVN